MRPIGTDPLYRAMLKDGDILPDPEPVDRHFRLKAWIAAACLLVAFWTFVVGGVVRLLAGGGE